MISPIIHGNIELFKKKNLLSQENNAVLKIDLFNQRIIELYALGAKNWTSYNLDASDQNDGTACCTTSATLPQFDFSHIRKLHSITKHVSYV